ncbi:hypothetical protein Tco_0040551 [Tanacetum coccineum]
MWILLQDTRMTINWTLGIKRYTEEEIDEPEIEAHYQLHGKVQELTMTKLERLAPPRQMTSDHNSSELEIHDHSNELSRSKLVPKVVPPADKNSSRHDKELGITISSPSHNNAEVNM